MGSTQGIADLSRFLAEADAVKFAGRSEPARGGTDSPTAQARQIVGMLSMPSATRGKGDA